MKPQPGPVSGSVAKDSLETDSITPKPSNPKASSAETGDLVITPIAPRNVFLAFIIDAVLALAKLFGRKR